MDRRDMPQIGSFVIEPELVAESGEPLEQLLARLSESGPPDIAEHAPDESHAVPVEGWRTLTAERGFLLGAPVDDTRQSWRVARLEPASTGHPNGQLHVHPDVIPLRPSQRERGRGLRLRWPDVTSADPDVENLWIDIVNDGDERWHPDGDGFHVAATIVRPGHDGAAFAYLAGGERAFPLDPGDYGRVRANLNLSDLDGIEPGEFDVHAWLVDLSIRTIDPLRVLITPEVVARRRAAVAARPPRPETVAAQHESRIAMLRTVLTARERLQGIVDILLEPSTGREQSIQRIAGLLECSPEDARGIYSMSLQRFDLHHEDWTARELQEVEQALLAESGGDGPAADD